ncbi:GUN4 domain-containing protein [Microcoleus sp. FACHB-1515]|uniref:GUN4 domain-containing protein n=1 Tax=Cyanophyceae TaxID=3028117 RepID=UPI0016854851|nr:GUN4 domain-containing protein [Microcoleus sp. FACHB-1515]MBD2089640.1 GUN4 domain-containing protein [Microcoleus sp. FACHB-1515]
MQSFRVVGSLSSHPVPIAAYPIQNEKFTKLEQLLATKEWQTANQETFAILSSICGLTSDRTIKIGNLSCYDLHLLDSLWLKYSRGRFGFSVQQRIWRQMCQDAIEIQNTQDSRWIQFCDRIGWNAPTNKLSAPTGYFPIWVEASHTQLTAHPAVFTRLYSRLEVCRLR